MCQISPCDLSQSHIEVIPVTKYLNYKMKMYCLLKQLYFARLYYVTRTLKSGFEVSTQPG